MTDLCTRALIPRQGCDVAPERGSVVIAPPRRESFSRSDSEQLAHDAWCRLSRGGPVALFPDDLFPTHNTKLSESYTSRSSLRNEESWVFCSEGSGSTSPIPWLIFRSSRSCIDPASLPLRLFSPVLLPSAPTVPPANYQTEKKVYSALRLLGTHTKWLSKKGDRY